MFQYMEYNSQTVTIFDTQTMSTMENEILDSPNFNHTYTLNRTFYGKLHT